MRLHITLDDELVQRLDEVAGPRGRSAFIVEVVTEALDRRRRLAHLEKAFGSIPAEGHDWDADPAAWVHAQRFADPGRVG